MVLLIFIRTKTKDHLQPYIDYRKVFDNIGRLGLWRKLLHHNIN